MLATCSSRRNLTDRVFITQECQLDFLMWKDFLSSLNGISMFINETINSPELMLFTDAAATIGYGGYFQTEWFASTWPQEVVSIANSHDSTMSIAWMELYPIVTAAVIWGQEWTNKSINFQCDNMATVAIINKGRSKSQFIMKLIRKLTLIAATYNFVFAATHVPGRLNCISDALSCLQLTRFRSLAPQAERDPVRCPGMADLLYP